MSVYIFTISGNTLKVLVLLILIGIIIKSIKMDLTGIATNHTVMHCHSRLYCISYCLILVLLVILVVDNI